MMLTAAVAAACAHVTNTFRFEVPAPMAKVAPLFAPVAERRWGDPGWDPSFLHPVPERDVEGAVFTVRHGDHRAVWVTTRFDPARGRMQYVYFVPGVQVAVIDVRVEAAGPTATRVEATYARTALDPAANAIVRQMGEADRDSGPEWRRGVETALGTRP